MLLKIILLVIFLQLGLERFREGMTNQYLDIEPPFLGVDCYSDVNILFPTFDKDKKTFSDKKRYLRNNRENIVTFATSPCE